MADSGNGMDHRSKPDIIIPYTSSDLAGEPVVLITVRPESNRIDYESVILRAVKPFARAIYMANLNGKFINEHAVVSSHYASQVQFATFGAMELSKYPVMVKKFEHFFKTDFQNAEILGSYEALINRQIEMSTEELFHTMVPAEDFLEFYGHTIKRIGNLFIINYDIPWILGDHNKDTNIFVVLLRLQNQSGGFLELNQKIYEEFQQQQEVALIDTEERKHLKWYNRIRRTYHISRNHIEASFDITDFVFNENGENTLFSSTPLGLELKKIGWDNTLINKRLFKLKHNPLVYINDKQADIFINIIRGTHPGSGYTMHDRGLRECARLIMAVDWDRV